MEATNIQVFFFKLMKGDITTFTIRCFADVLQIVYCVRNHTYVLKIFSVDCWIDCIVSKGRKMKGSLFLIHFN